MTYKDLIHQAMLKLAGDERVVFIGQGLYEEEAFYGTLKGVPNSRMLEMPCAEILSTGVAIGLALTGWIPVLLFQRMDFMLLAADQLINHAALFPEMSGGQIKVPMIVRACVGSQSEKFIVGKQHNKDFSGLFDSHMKVRQLYAVPGETFKEYAEESFSIPSELTMTIEWKDRYSDAI